LVGMIADGVGRGVWGEEASRLAIEVMAQYLVHSVRSFDTSDEAGERAFLKALQIAVMQCDANVAQMAWEKPGAQGMATGLVMWVGMWPRAYALCIGSSRMYALIEGQLTQLNAPGPDVPRGILGQSSSLPDAFPFGQSWGQVGLMCTKGLTNHVSEEQIRKRLSTATSAKQACQELLEDALNAGGTENITIVVGRINPNRQG
jgi:protein phosphatase